MPETVTQATDQNPLQYISDQLNDLRVRGVAPKLRVLSGEQRAVSVFDGREVINLASNNYLGLTTHKALRRAALEAYLRDVVRGSFPNLPYDEAAAEWHGGERARLESLGRPAPFVDGQIASIAHVHGLVLVTTNDHDFVRFKDLRVENWSKRHVRSKTEAT